MDKRLTTLASALLADVQYVGPNRDVDLVRRLTELRDAASEVEQRTPLHALDDWDDANVVLHDPMTGFWYCLHSDDDFNDAPVMLDIVDQRGDRIRSIKLSPLDVVPEYMAPRFSHWFGIVIGRTLDEQNTDRHQHLTLPINGCECAPCLHAAAPVPMSVALEETN